MQAAPVAHSYPFRRFASWRTLHGSRVATTLLAVLLCSLQLSCLRIRESFEVAADLSGRVHLEIFVPSALLPRAAAQASARLGPSDLILPTGVTLTRHEVSTDRRAHELHFELTLAFEALDQLAGVALRYPGSTEEPSIFPWRGLSVRRTNTKIEITRAAYGKDEISAELLASRPEGRLAASAIRWSTAFRFEARAGERWIAPRGGWISVPGTNHKQWTRVRAWGEHLSSEEEPLRALIPLSALQSLKRAGVGAALGLLHALPWILIALWFLRVQAQHNKFHHNARRDVRSG